VSNRDTLPRVSRFELLTLHTSQPVPSCCRQNLNTQFSTTNITCWLT